MLEVHGMPLLHDGCPFQVPTYEWNARLPKVRKCDMCFERQSKGQPTACTEACPTGATICGELDAMVAEARKRLAEKPKDYYQRIYGLEEVGGTSVLYLSAVPFEQLGLKTTCRGTPSGADVAGLVAVPDVVSVGSVLLGGIYWITSRRDESPRRRASGHATPEDDGLEVIFAVLALAGLYSRTCGPFTVWARSRT